MEFGLLVRWGVVLALLTLLGAPISKLIFARLPRGGAAFSLPVSLVLVSTIAFLVGQITFGRHTLVFAVLVLAACSLVIFRAGYVPDWRAVGISYGIFLFGFLLYATYAAHTSAITPRGGEQFLHYGLTNAVINAEVLPPEDFWFAGEEMRYYYGTQLQVGLLSMITGTELRYGYYLGLSAFYGLLFVCAYGLTGAIVAASGRSYHLGGLLGACFVAIGGTLVTALRLVFGQLPRSTASEYGQAVYSGFVEERLVSFAEAHQEQGSVSEWFWFYDRYVVEGALHEFPFYSLIKADLHGHSLSTGYIVLAAGVAFSYYVTPAEQRLRRLGLVYGGLGLLAGLFGFMNTWSLPTAVGLAWLAMALADPHPVTLLPERLVPDLSAILGREASEGPDGPVFSLASEFSRIPLAAVLAIPVAFVGIAVASPFLVFGSVPTNEGIGLFPPRTELSSCLVLYGGVLLVSICYLVVSARSTSSLSPLHLGAGTVLVALVGISTVATLGVVALLSSLILVAWWAVRTERSDFTAVALIAGLGLLLSLELVHAKVYPFERIRWNTTLKVAVQGWTLIAVGAGSASAYLLSWARDTVSEFRTTLRESDGSGDLRYRSVASGVLVGILVVAVILSSLPFAGLALYHNVGDGLFSPEDGSFDGLAVHDQYKTEEMEGIYWLSERSQPTIVEAPARRAYQWKSTASVFTDAVTVAGWNHQEGYRGEDAYEERATAVESIYTGSLETVMPTLDRYDVDYVYVGPSERESFDSINDFRGLDCLDVAFDNEAVTIYEVSEQSQC